MSFVISSGLAGFRGHSSWYGLRAKIDKGGSSRHSGAASKMLVIRFSLWPPIKDHTQRPTLIYPYICIHTQVDAHYRATQHLKIDFLSHIYGCICVGLCMLWVVVEIIFSIFETALDCLGDLPLSILARRPHKEPCLREPAEPEVKGGKRTKGVGQLGMGLWQ